MMYAAFLEDASCYYRLVIDATNKREANKKAKAYIKETLAIEGVFEPIKNKIIDVYSKELFQKFWKQWIKTSTLVESGVFFDNEYKDY